MRHRTTTLLLALALSAAPALAAETRCGWLQNPTPGNWWLVDNKGMWIMRSQGDEDGPPGMDLIPDISERDYVATNGNYGYACACMSVETDSAEAKITEILSFRQLSLSQCENDAALPTAE
ncbi:DUF4087 domain-containing protein [Pararhizobium antarcticum]|uniref:DUF4087 domain-containing protein n=1 Tax=Pararhizobium antarcticum TaxID=1798805 RepID=A0A657LS75_9HYPH|nr:DUF4087 domain-containing protein [Pararhizobium antarcticum]OJF91990.1 hypothetical protein AX761_05755 [Rhizobium sp. 58]OJF96057.1 hypothetical protein AX760_18565 [Pararhizobium antarcticum]